MKLLMITQWYPPEPGPARVPAVIAQGLKMKGHQPVVLTGFPNYPTGVIQDGWKIKPLQIDKHAEAQVYRVPLLPSHSQGALGRILNYASFGITTSLSYPALRALRKLKKPDAVWISYSPVTVGFAQLMVKLIDQVPIIVWVGDLWPDTIGVSGIDGAHGLARLAGPVLHWWCNLLYKSASAVVVISPGVADILVSRGVPREKIHFIPVAPDEALFHSEIPDRDTWNFPNNQKILLYAGAMGAAQELETLIRASAVASKSPLIVIAGSGTEEQKLRLLAEKLNAPVKFIGRVPEEKMASLLASADMAFIGLAKAPLSAVTMPSKTQSLLASGKPILCCAEGDVAQIIEEANCGWTIAPGDNKSLAQKLEQLALITHEELESKQKNALLAYRQRFHPSAIAGSYNEIMEAITTPETELAPPADGITAHRGFRTDIARDLAQLHTKAFPDFFLSSLGINFLGRFYRAFAKDESGVSIVYRRGEKVVGIAVGTTQPNGFYSRLLKKDFFFLGLTAAQAAINNPRAIPRILRGLTYRGQEAAESGQGLLASICVDKSERGNGLGSALTADFMEAMRDAGASSIVLTTDADGNDSVNSMYLRLGWKLKNTSRTPEGRRMNHYVYLLD